MFKIDDVGGLFFTMPPNFQTDEVEAFCYAIDRQFKRVVAIARKLNVWSDLDHADPKHYDIMAKTLDAPFYRSELTDDQKLALIKGAMELKKYAGTVKGVEALLHSMFDEADFIPWYNYGGDPYHFKVQANDPRTPEAERMFVEILEKTKAVRSIFDTIETIRNTEQELHIGGHMGGYIVGAEIEQEDIT